MAHYAEKTAAEQAAKAVHGRRIVANEIKVQMLGAAKLPGYRFQWVS